MSLIPYTHVQQAKSTCKKGKDKTPCKFHVKCYVEFYKCKSNKEVAGEASAFVRCPQCAFMNLLVRKYRRAGSDPDFMMQGQLMGSEF